MAVRIVRLGTPRPRGGGLHIGTVRRPLRGVRKEEYAARDYDDVWLPDLAPSQALVRWTRCHRSVLRHLLAEHGASVTDPGRKPGVR